MTRSPRDVVKELATNARIFQLATSRADGPRLCHLWFAASFEPDRIFFTSNPIRNHSKDLQTDNRVSGAIIGHAPDELGDPVQGLVFTGEASAVNDDDLETAVAAFLTRWPRASEYISVEGLRTGSSRNLLYEVRVTNWVLHDEVNFAGDPRQLVTGL